MGEDAFMAQRWSILAAFACACMVGFALSAQASEKAVETNPKGHSVDTVPDENKNRASNQGVKGDVLGDIFVVHSRHPTSQEGKAALEQIQARYGENYAITDVFLAARGRPISDVLAEGRFVIENRLGDRKPPKLVFTFGEEALYFVATNYADLFPKTPVVFAHIGSSALARQVTEHPNFSGVTESLSIEKTIELARAINDEPLRIVKVIVDNQKVQKLFEKILKNTNSNFTHLKFIFIVADQKKYDDIFDEIADETHGDTTFLFVGASKDVLGKHLAKSDFVQKAQSRARRPIYVLLADQVAAGAVGGHVLSYRAQVREALHYADFRLGLLAKDAEPLKAVAPSPNYPVINRPVADAFALNYKDYHTPLQFVEKPLPISYGGGGLSHGIYALAVVPTLLVAFLLWYLRKLKQKLDGRAEELEATQGVVTEYQQFDQLTGLWNRQMVTQSLYEIFTPSAPIIADFHVDLARFIPINTTLGAEAGDHVLKVAAERLKAIVSERGVLGRIGDDEFMIVEQFDNEEEIGFFSDRIVEALREPIAFEGHICRVGANVGVAFEGAEFAESTQSEMFRGANLALNKAKQAGRNSTAVSTSEDREAAQKFRQLTDGILRGLEEGEFRPYFQPQICSQTGDLVALESLARWHHPEQGVLGPYAFADAAEFLGVIENVDHQILEHCVAHLKEWSTTGLYIPQLSVNVSSRRMESPTLCDNVSALNFDEAVLAFELLESTFLDSGDAAIFGKIDALKKMGVAFEVDDFGTGHASVLSVMRIKPQRVKIAREMIVNIEPNSSSLEMVRSIVDIAKSLEIGVTAEGIENAEQMDLLRELGVDVFQGFHISRPMSPEATQIWLRDRSLDEAI